MLTPSPGEASPSPAIALELGANAIPNGATVTQPLSLRETLEKCRTPAAFLAALEIEAMPDQDELLKLVDTSSRGKKDREAVMQGLFHFVACLVRLSIGPQAQNEQGLWEAYGVGGLDVLDNYPKKEENRTVVFAGLPNNTWPTGFPEYMSSKYAEAPSIEWCTRNNVAAYSEERRKLVFVW